MPTRPSRAPLRLAAVLAAAAVVGVLTAQMAEAHVRVLADSTETGSFSQLTFRVPNESDTVGTVTLQVTLPQDHPFLDVSTKPLPGWSATVTEQPLPAPVTIEGTTVTTAVRTVTWQADAGVRIGPGEYQDFDLSAGPLPAPGTILLPATQTYSDGTVVAWDQPTPVGGAEPEHPAPELVVAAAAVGAPTPVSQPTTPDPLARVLAGAALLVAVIGTIGAGLAVRRRPESAPTG